MPTSEDQVRNDLVRAISDTENGQFGAAMKRIEEARIELVRLQGQQRRRARQRILSNSYSAQESKALSFA